MQVGTPRQLYETPQNTFVAQFIGSPKMNLLPCRVHEGRFHLDGGGSGALPKDAQATQVGVRPEHIAVVDTDAGHCSGTVEVSEYLGADYFHYVDCGDLGRLTVRTSGATEDIEGQKIGLMFDEPQLHFFDEHGQRL